MSVEIYSRVARNAFVQAQPSELHFAGFETTQDGVLRQQLRLVNVATEVTRFHIVPPEDTTHFTLRYTKPARLVPGFAVECVLEFRPDEARYYYDAIRVHSKVCETDYLALCAARSNVEVSCFSLSFHIRTKRITWWFRFMPTPFWAPNCRFLNFSNLDWCLLDEASGKCSRSGATRLLSLNSKSPSYRIIQPSMWSPWKVSRGSDVF